MPAHSKALELEKTLKSIILSIYISMIANVHIKNVVFKFSMKSFAFLYLLRLLIGCAECDGRRCRSSLFTLGLAEGGQTHQRLPGDTTGSDDNATCPSACCAACLTALYKSLTSSNPVVMLSFQKLAAHQQNKHSFNISLRTVNNSG